MGVLYLNVEVVVFLYLKIYNIINFINDRYLENQLHISINISKTENRIKNKNYLVNLKISVVELYTNKISIKI